MTLYFFILYRKKAERLFRKKDDYNKFSLLYNIILNNILCGSVDNNNGSSDISSDTAVMQYIES